MSLSENGDTMTFTGTGEMPLGLSLQGATKVIIEGYTSIADRMFYNNSTVESIDIRSLVTRIGASAFQGCSLLQYVTIPSTITSFGTDAFSGGHTDMVITVTFTGIGTLYNSPTGTDGVSSFPLIRTITTNLSIVSIHVTLVGYTRIDDYVFRDSNVASIILPDALMGIGGFAFANTKLTTISIPDSVSQIDANAFQESPNLKYITIPSSITHIGGYVFYGCTSLHTVYFDTYSVLEVIETSAFKNSALVSVIIPPTVTGIATDAFDNCALLESVTTTINGSGALTNTLVNANLAIAAINKEATLHIILTGHTSIDTDAFKNNVSVKTITIPNTVTSIGASAFNGCLNLEKIIFENGSTLGSIGSAACYVCL